MNRWRWELLRTLRLIGVPGWAGVGLLAACAGLWWGVSAPLAADHLRLVDDSARLRQKLQTLPEAPAADADPRQQLQRFEQRFPGAKGIAPALVRLHAVARRHGVLIDQAEFKFVSEATEPLARYSMVLPVTADYRSLRRFSRDLLRELPGLALEEVNLRRNDPGTAQLEAQLRLVMFISKAP